MSHAQLTHPDRGTLAFEQAQTDENTRDATGNVTAELGTDRPPLVHIETRERERSINGRVTAPRRARNSGTGDWEQALADYVDLLESHVDEFQGTGYTFEDSLRGDEFRAILESVEWTLSRGAPYEVQFTSELKAGRGTMQAQGVDRRNPSVRKGMDVAARAGGVDLPGLRELRVSRSIGVDVTPIYNKSSAENNDVVASEGPRHEVVFKGTHWGSHEERAAADAELEALEDQGQIDLTLRFPGYTLEGFVMGYDSNLESRLGERQHQYEVRFLEGVKA